MRIRNLALTKKSTDKFYLFFTDITYVHGQFSHIYIYIFFFFGGGGGHRTINQKILWAQYLINCQMGRIPIFYSGSLGISYDLIHFWEEYI